MNHSSSTSSTRKRFARERSRTFKLQEKWYIAAAVLFACAAAFPLLMGGGLLNTRGGGDSPFLIQRLHQLTTAIQDGHFPVRWMPDANFGYGYPFFNFYAPFAFYVAYLFRLLGFGTIRAIQLSQLGAFIVAGWGMYRLGRRWFSQPAAALLTSIAYTFAPFHLVNVYVRGDSIAEFWAMAFYPLVIWAVDSLLTAETSQTRRRQTAVLGLAYGALVISHNISAMIFSPFVLLYALGRLWQQTGPEKRLSKKITVTLSHFSAGIILGVLLSAWFWLPAIGEQALTQLSEITVGYFDYNYGDGFHFRSTDLVQQTFFYDPDVGNGDAFRMGLVQALLITAALLTTLWQWWRTQTIPRLTLTLIASLLVATFMMHPWSRFLWDSLPLLPYTQFPWRFLSVQAFWGAAVCGLLFSGQRDEGEETENRSAHTMTLILLPLAALLLFSSFGRFKFDYLITPEREISAEGIARYEWFTGNIGTTISAEYLSGEMSPRPYTSSWLQTGDRWQAQTLTGKGIATLTAHKTERQTWQIEITSPQATIKFPLMYWPGWIAETAEGEPLNLQTATGSGLAQLTLPQGSHEVVLRLTRTPLRATGEIISLSILPLLLIFLWVTRPSPPSQWGAEPRKVAAVVACMALVVILGSRWNGALANLPTGVTSWDFGLMGFLHYDGSVAYGNNATLADVRYSTTELTAGQTVDITLLWESPADGEEPRQATIALVTPANNFFNDVEPIASQTFPLNAGETTYSLTIPDNAPAGLVVPYLTLNDRNRPRTFSGNKRGFLYFAPIRVLDSAVATNSNSPLDVRAVTVTHTPPRILQFQLQWHTAAPLPKRYAVSLRLTDESGREIHGAQLDTQLGYGQRPSDLWPTNQWVDDWLTTHFPEDGAPFPPPYVVLVKLYDPQDGQTLLTRRLGTLVSSNTDPQQLQFAPHQPTFTLPTDLVETEVLFQSAADEPLIALRGYTLTQHEDKLDLVLYWEALADMTADYTHFAHLIDPHSGQPVAQHDGQPRNNTYPTSQWQTGEIVADPFTLFTADLPAGEFHLQSGLYEIVGESYPRLTAVVSGETADNGAISLQKVTHE